MGPYARGASILVGSLGNSQVYPCVKAALLVVYLTWPCCVPQTTPGLAVYPKPHMVVLYTAYQTQSCCGLGIASVRVCVYVHARVYVYLWWCV